jgi:hypothetical protein
VVHLVEVDHVGLQAPHAGLEMTVALEGAQVAAGAVGLAVCLVAVHRVVDLGREGHVAAPSAALREPVAQALLGVAVLLLPAIDVGGVEEVDPELERPVHDGETVLDGGVPAEVHRAEAAVAHLHPVAPQPPVVSAHPQPR